VTRNGQEAWEALQGNDPPPLAILDWMMPGMDGLEVCRRVRHEISDSHTYLILLTAKSRKEDLIEALESGADDFITKPFDRQELRVRLQAGARIVKLQRSLAVRVRQLQEAVTERERAEEELRNLTLTDDLTGLYNHRGFFTLSSHCLKTAHRTNQSSLIFYIDLDGLKQINDTFGHKEGSRAIASAAEILRRTFRESDVVARIGGDEFAILAANVSYADADSMTDRLTKNIRAYNEDGRQSYALSMSFGVVCAEAGTTLTIEELIARADEAMYEQKRSKRKPSEAPASNFNEKAPLLTPLTL
jgi:diguanylate cyclase (GGDEF)-like protein